MGIRGLLISMLLACGCAGGVRHVQGGMALEHGQKWVLLPVQNRAETPLAGERAESLVATMLRIRGVGDLDIYPPEKREDGDLPQLDERRRYQDALDWARKQGFAYGVTGSVNEWHYRNGPDGDPAVGLALEVIELATGKVVWSAAGAKSGWGSDTVSGTAERLIGDLVAQMEIK